MLTELALFNLIDFQYRLRVPFSEYNSLSSCTDFHINDTRNLLSIVDEYLHSLRFYGQRPAWFMLHYLILMCKRVEYLQDVALCLKLIGLTGKCHLQLCVSMCYYWVLT